MRDIPPLRFHPRDGSPFDLGHGLAAVGPGWWLMVREVFVWADSVGAQIMLVRQKHCLLDVLISHPGGRRQSHEIREVYERRSARICEVCGEPTVPVVERIPRPTRTHCDGCTRRWQSLEWDERALWMEHAGTWLPEWRIGG